MVYLLCRIREEFASGWTSTVGWFLPSEDPAMESYQGATQQPATVGNPLLFRIMRKLVTLPDGSRHSAAAGRFVAQFW